MQKEKNTISPSTPKKSFNEWLKNNFKYIGHTIKTKDSEIVMYYQQPNGYIVSTSNIYELAGFSFEDGGIKKVNDTLINIHQKDVTNFIKEDAKKFYEISKDLKNLLLG